MWKWVKKKKKDASSCQTAPLLIISCLCGLCLKKKKARLCRKEQVSGGVPQNKSMRGTLPAAFGETQAFFTENNQVSAYCFNMGAGDQLQGVRTERVGHMMQLRLESNTRLS